MDAMNQGKLVPEEVISDMLSKRLEEGFYRDETGFIFNGIPLTRMQVEKGKQGDEEAQWVRSRQQLKFIQRLAPPLFAAFVALSPIITPPVSDGQTIDAQRGASLFRRACIGCHDAGGNIIQPGATLFQKDLQR